MAEDVSYDSIAYLTSDALNILYRLNTKRLLPSPLPNKLPRDYRGLANLVGITAQDLDSSHQNTTKWTLETWVRKNEDSANVHHLLRHLETIDRYDIKDDLLDLAIKKQLINRELKWITENQVAQVSQDAEELLTMDDVDEGAPVEYDALVLYAEADQDFVDVMISHMTAIGFRLFTKHSLRPGIMPYRPMTELINSRCRYIILVYSPAFFESLDNKFYAEFVQARNIETRKHMMIPCMYKQCELPPHFKFYFPLYVSSLAYNFWERLAKSVDEGRVPRLTTSSTVRIRELNSNQQLRITNGPVSNSQMSNGQMSNGQISNGQMANGQICNGQMSNGQIPNGTSLPSNAYVTQTTETITLPEPPTTTLSLSVSTLNSRRIDTASLNEISVNKKKKSNFSFLRRPFRWAMRNKSKKALIATN